MKIQRHIQCFTTENYPKDTETEYRLKIIMGALRISNIRLTYKNIPLVEYIFKNLCKDMDNFEIKLNDSISVNGMNNYDTYLIKLGYKQHISKYSIDCNNFVYVFSDEELNKDYLKDIAELIEVINKQSDEESYPIAMELLTKYKSRVKDMITKLKKEFRGGTKHALHFN